MSDRTTAYTDLDSLMDTRLSTLYSLNENSVTDVLTTGKYFKRVNNKFPYVNFDTFMETYRNRDKHIYKEALATPVLTMIKEWVISIKENEISGPEIKEPVVVVNVYPYKFTEEELFYIQKGLYLSLGSIADVEFVDYPIEELTPTWFKDRDVDLIVMYDYVNWIESMSINGTFSRDSCPHITMFGPAISFLSNDPTPEEMAKAIETMESLAAPFVNLRLLPIDVFSIAVDPDSIKKK